MKISWKRRLLGVQRVQFGGNTDIKRNGGSLKYEEINRSGNLNDFRTVIEGNLEGTIGENTGMEMSRSLLEHEKVNFSANLDDFAEEFHSPVCNSDIALGDTVETIMGGTTVRNSVCKFSVTIINYFSTHSYIVNIS